MPKEPNPESGHWCPLPNTPILLLLTAAVLPAYDFTPPRIPPARPSPRWEKLLRTQVRYLRSTTPGGEIPNELEHSIRPLTATALNVAVCLKFSECDDPPATLEFTRRILRGVTRTHRTGGGTTATGRPWGHQWQSALWAWQAAFAAWLLWTDLPAAAREIYENLKWFSLPDGSLLYPTGTDWNLHRVDMTAGLHVAMERLLGDRHAGALAEAALGTLEKMQARNPGGRTFAPGEFPSYPTHEPNTAWSYAFAVLYSRLGEPARAAVPIAQVWRDLEGARFFDDARLLLMRTRDAVSSFSWGLRVMGLTVPFAPDPIVNPLNHSYVGLAAELAAGRDKPGRTGIAALRWNAPSPRTPSPSAR